MWVSFCVCAPKSYYHLIIIKNCTYRFGSDQKGSDPTNKVQIRPKRFRSDQKGSDPTEKVQIRPKRFRSEQKGSYPNKKVQIRPKRFISDQKGSDPNYSIGCPNFALKKVSLQNET